MVCWSGRRCRSDRWRRPPPVRSRLPPSATAVTNCDDTAALRASSAVVAFCSTAAAATAPNTGCMFSIISVMRRSPPRSVAAASCCSLPIFCAISSVAFWVSTDSALTSSATTAKPRPAAPARAASILALSASRLVCLAIAAMRLTTLPISPDDSFRPSRLDAGAARDLMHLGGERACMIDLPGDLGRGGGKLLGCRRQLGGVALGVVGLPGQRLAALADGFERLHRGTGALSCTAPAAPSTPRIIALRSASSRSMVSRMTSTRARRAGVGRGRLRRRRRWPPWRPGRRRDGRRALAAQGVEDLR